MYRRKEIKIMKKAAVLLAGVLFTLLTACSAESGMMLALLNAFGGQPEPSDLVFVNDSDAVIVEVVVDFVDRGGGARYADCKPLKRGETFGFEAGEYPVTVAIYDAPFGSDEEKELARLTIPEAPPEGERWYIAAQDGAGGLTLLADTVWPADSGGED